MCVGKVWRYQQDNQKPSIEEGQSTQWPKVKGQKDKQVILFYWNCLHAYS
jgi:hypothetical protein